MPIQHHSVHDYLNLLNRHVHSKLDPIANVIGILEDHFVHVVDIDTADGFDGISAVAYDTTQQVVAAAAVTGNGVAGERQRLSLVHELGHLVLRLSSDVDEEKAAFRFGAAFLAPAESLYLEVGRQRTSISLTRSAAT